MKMKITAVVAVCLLSAPFVPAQEKTTIRFGHFPNITHAQGVIAHALSRQGKGWFEKRLGPNVEIQWFTYNAWARVLPSTRTSNRTAKKFA